jgi:hypothetical protein
MVWSSKFSIIISHSVFGSFTSGSFLPYFLIRSFLSLSFAEIPSYIIQTYTFILVFRIYSNPLYPPIFSIFLLLTRSLMLSASKRFLCYGGGTWAMWHLLSPWGASQSHLNSFYLWGFRSIRYRDFPCSYE